MSIKKDKHARRGYNDVEGNQSRACLATNPTRTGADARTYEPGAEVRSASASWLTRDEGERQPAWCGKAVVRGEDSTVIG
jgi:hypothetical protein